jgi:SAM-dependent methyltransferase
LNYAENFDLQWNTFRSTQLDSHTGTTRNAANLFRSTRWSPDELKGKTVLEAGCGPGKYTEILLKAGMKVTAFDLTTAVFVNQEQNRLKGNLTCFQGDIYALPEIGQFDYVFCYGVLQHCPDPTLAYKKIFEKLKPGGCISIDYYTNPSIPTPWTTPKYFWRKWTSNMDPKVLLRRIQLYLPFWLPIDTVIRVVPLLGPRLLGHLRIPCWNYLDVLKHNLKTKPLPLAIAEWYRWAVMDTFDALGAKYDFPKTLDEVREMMSFDNACDIEVFYGSNGIVGNATKKLS